MFSRWKKPQEPEEPEEIVQEAPLSIEGTLPCNEEGCASQKGAPCEYIDRRKVRCVTAWCPEHQIVLDGHCYCRRHANTIEAIGGIQVTTYGAALPDIGNRMPNLVRWISNDLDGSIRTLLEGVHRPDELFKREPVHAVRGIDGFIRWEMTWQLFNQTGSTLRVTIEVDEREPVVVIARVSNARVFAASPPWIAANGDDPQGVHSHADESQRQAFYADMSTHIQEGIALDREASSAEQ